MQLAQKSTGGNMQDRIGCSYLVSQVSNFIFRVFASTVEAEEVLSFATVCHMLEHDIAEAALALHEHLALLVLLLV